MKTYLKAAITSLVLSLSTIANAGLIIDAGPSSNVQTWVTGNYTAGTEFTTSASLTIRSLGYLDAEGDGLFGSHMVGLWSVVNQTLMASVIVDSSSSTILSAQGTGMWYMGNITAMTIGPGTYRVAGLIGDHDNNALSNGKIGNGVTLSNGYVRNNVGDGFSFPGLTFGSNGIRATLSTDAVGTTPPNQIPEPTTLAIFALGVIGLASRRFKK